MASIFSTSSFRNAWSASTLSMMGTRTLSVTYPLLAFTLTGSPSWTGWVVCAATLPGLLCYLPAGTVIDQLGPRRVMAWSELARGLVMVVALGMWVLGALRIEHLLVVAFVEGCLTVLSSVAETALIPATVQPKEIGAALAVHETTVHAVGLAGRSLGGVLYAFGPSAVFLANVVAFVSAATALSRIRSGDTVLPRPPRRPLADEIRAGVREIWQNAFLRSATMLTALINLLVQALTVLYVTHLTATGVSPVAVGVTLAAASVGGVLGALISPQRRKISRKIYEKTSRLPGAWFVEWIGLARRGRSMLLVHTWMCAGALVLAMLTSLAPLTFAVALLMVGLGGGLSNVTVRTVLSRVAPDKIARVVSISRLVSYGGAALGPLLAGLLYACAGAGFTAATLALSMLALAFAATMVPSLRSSLSPNWPPRKPSAEFQSV